MARRTARGFSLPLLAAVVVLAALTRWLPTQLDTAAAETQPGSETQASDKSARKPGKSERRNAPKKRKPGPVPAVFDAGSPWSSPEACEAVLRARARKPRGKSAPRIGTWNLGWFPDGVAHGPNPDRARNVPWLACVIVSMDVQVLAVQEVVQHPRGRAALLDLRRELDQRTGGHWDAELDACPDDGRQHVGFLYDAARVELRDTRVLGRLNPARNACDMRLRPGLSSRLRWKNGGPDVTAITVHFDSGVVERDYAHRQTSVARLHELLPSLLGQDDDLLLLGDFNSMGCETCLPKVSAAQELDALDASVAGLAPSLMNVAPTHACTEYYRGRGVRLDHVLVTRGMRELADDARVETHGLCEALACARLASASRVPASVRLSDHCPLVLQLAAADRDQKRASGL